MFVGHPPRKPPGRVDMALVLLGFVVWCFITAFAWGAMPPLLTLAFFALWLSVILGRLGSLASYHRWRGDRPGGLLRLGSSLAASGFMALLLAHFVVAGQWGWLWWALIVNALVTVVLVAGHYYGPEAEPHPEDAPPEGRTSSN